MSVKRARHQAKRARRRAQPTVPDLPGHATCETCGHVGKATRMIELHAGGRTRSWHHTPECQPDPVWLIQQLQRPKP